MTFVRPAQQAPVRRPKIDGLLPLASQYNPLRKMPNFRNQPQRRIAPKETAPVVERPGPTILSNGTKDWTAYNMTVVGWSPEQLRPCPHPRELPGLAAARERGLAAQAAYLATRKTYTYANDEDGWQRVVRKVRRSKRNDDRLHEED